MTQVTINGNTYSDQGESAKDMRSGGHRTHFLPLIKDVVSVSAQVSNNTNLVKTNTDLVQFSAASASSYATSAAQSALDAYAATGIDMAAISKTITVNTTGLFIYNTAKDSDGGQQAKRNGVKAVTLYVVDATNIYVYDATNTSLTLLKTITGLTGLSSVTANNGMLYVTGTVTGLHQYNIFNGYNVVATPALVSLVANKVLTVTLDDAPINKDNGLLIPVVYVATSGGLSRIAEDETVSNWTDTSGSNVNYIKSIFISNNTILACADVGGYGKHLLTFDINQPLPASSYITRNFTGQSAGSIWNANLTNYTSNSLDSITNQTAYNAIASNKGLTLLKPNPAQWGNGLHATITSRFNSGYQYGDIRGCWLADTVQGNLSGSNVLPIGNFASSTGWTVQAGWSITGTNATINSTATAGLYTDSALYLTVGKSYTITIDVTSITAGTIRLQSYFDNDKYKDITTAGIYTLSVTMQVGGGNLNIWGVGATTATISSITIIEEVQDRSYNNTGLLVNGTLTRTPVAVGSELVGFVGWSATNYLSHAHDTRFDFGTGDFNVSCWFQNTDSVANDMRLLNYWQPDLGNAANRIDIFKQGTGSAIQINVGVIVIKIPISLTDTSYRKLNLIRKSGVLYAYLDGQLITQIACTDSIGNALFSLYVGQLANLTQAWSGGIALLHIGAGAQTQNQIKYTYNEEKNLFNGNTACTLAGVSDGCKAVAYDGSTQLRHVATTTNLSTFKGLVRVGSETGTYTQLDADNEFIVRG